MRSWRSSGDDDSRQRVGAKSLPVSKMTSFWSPKQTVDGKSIIDPETLRQFVPLSELTPENLRELASKTPIDEIPAGKALFTRGSTDNKSYYLLSGDMELETNGDVKVITGGTPKAKFPLDHHRPRQATAKAKSAVRYIAIDNDYLDILLTWGQNAGYMVTEIAVAEETEVDSGDWMTDLLRSSLFHRIPAGNIQKMFIKMEELRVGSGQTVIRQGDEGDYYYYIKEGRCVVTRDTKDGKVIKLAELESGSSFGEEALISGAARNANVTMLVDGVLMRLKKEDFDALLKEPVLHSVTIDQAQEMVTKGNARFLDVRLESEYKNYAIPGAINIPLFLLRIKMQALNRDLTYIVYCDTGRRSSSATYLLNEKGIEAVVLKGGLMALRQDQKPSS